MILTHRFVPKVLLLVLLFLGTTQLQAQTGNSSAYPAQIISPTIPTSISFCGEKIDLTRYNNRERMDREMLSFCYMHSTSLQLLKKANRYFPVIEPILKEEGIPSDFIYLMVIESHLNPRIRSGAGAVGLWQFMPKTARDYGLEVNKNIDERCHIEKSTRAACKYLKDAYKKFNDWSLVAISYNAGIARISRLVAQQEVKKASDLYLVTETSRYLFRIVAAKAFFNNPVQFGFRIHASDLYAPLRYTKKVISTGIANLAAYAKQNKTTYALLKDANPWLKDTFLQNRSKRRYTLLLPVASSLYYNPSTIKPYRKEWVVSK
ncbi:MAG: lytic transglycosylase domain-containing protein [Bacteroidaceae bacterium]